MSARIILIDDDDGIRFSFKRYLDKSGYEVETAELLADARDKMERNDFEIALLDVNLPDGSGIEFVKELREKYPAMAIVLITGHGNISLAVQAMKNGADNFLTKPVNMTELDISLQKSDELHKLRHKNLTQQRLKQQEIIPFWGTSPLMQRVKKLAEIACQNDSTVLLYGETGTGKEVMARWVHNNSLRKDKPFVEVNCAGLKDELLTSELFGHAKGAFTTALKDRQGLIEAANGGTLFLDEISSMNMNIQAQLLKVIEEKTFRRLGETKVRRSDFRLICATNRDIRTEVDNERFRDDLYFRINIFPLDLPPLRDLPDNLPAFIQHLLAGMNYNYPNVSLEVMELLTSYGWPGNIREMKNVLERAVILSLGKPLSVNDFPGIINRQNFDSMREIKELSNFELEYINYVVRHFNNDTKKAADALGISRASLYRKLNKIKDEQK